MNISPVAVGHQRNGLGQTRLRWAKGHDRAWDGRQDSYQQRCSFRHASILPASYFLLSCQFCWLMPVPMLVSELDCRPLSYQIIWPTLAYSIKYPPFAGSRVKDAWSRWSIAFCYGTGSPQSSATGLAQERTGVLGPDLLQPRLCYHIHLHCAYCIDFQTVTLMVREISPTDSCSVMSWTSKPFKEPLQFPEDVNDRGSEWASFGSWLRGDWTAPSTTTWSSSKGRKWSRHPVICIPW